MFDEPEELPGERMIDPAGRAREKGVELRMHAERAAVYEGCRKFDARLQPGLDFAVAREVQRGMAMLERRKMDDLPILSPDAAADAMAMLALNERHDLAAGDYHLHRRPGEVMVVRWLAGAAVGAFYERMQAHADAALEQSREDDRAAMQWRQEPGVLPYLEALDALRLDMPAIYLRELIRAEKQFVLSTQTSDDLNIEYLSQHLMGISTADFIGRANAPGNSAEAEGGGAVEEGGEDSADYGGDDAAENGDHGDALADEPAGEWTGEWSGDIADEPQAGRSWFFKLFSLRGMIDNEERMCFFTYLQRG